MICERCGCDDDYSCREGCIWVAPDLCSRCSVFLLREAGQHEAADQLDRIAHQPMLQLAMEAVADLERDGYGAAFDPSNGLRDDDQIYDPMPRIIQPGDPEFDLP